MRKNTPKGPVNKSAEDKLGASAIKRAELVKKNALNQAALAKKSAIPTKRPVAPNKKLK